MADADLTLLCIGDVHLGRHPTRIPEDRDGDRFSPAAVWRSAVQAAIDEGVDAVVLTGDMVDRDNRYFEAYGTLEVGVRELRDAGIPVVAVAGNHDFDVLPKLAADFEGLHLLGDGSAWGRYTLERDGRALVHFDGWSFPDRHFADSPLDSFDLEPVPDPEVPVVGVLHTELDVAGSPYAPVVRSRLVETGARAWLLGHAHRPGIERDADPLILYPGSPQPLSPTEVGAHGPWIVRLGFGDESGDPVTAWQLPLATVRYLRLSADAEEIAEPNDVPPLLSEELRRHLESEGGLGSVELLLARIALTGRTPAHRDLVRESARIRDELGLSFESIPVVVEELTMATRPDVDLRELSRGDTPVAWLSRLLLDLDEGEGRGGTRRRRGRVTAAMCRDHSRKTVSRCHSRNSRLGRWPASCGVQIRLPSSG